MSLHKHTPLIASLTSVEGTGVHICPLSNSERPWTDPEPVTAGFGQRDRALDDEVRVPAVVTVVVEVVGSDLVAVSEVSDGRP